MCAGLGVEASCRSLSPIQQLLPTLRFYAFGLMFASVGDFTGVTKSTASVTERIVPLLNSPQTS